MDNILEYIKQLTDASLYDEAFVCLVLMFFEDLLIDDLTPLEEFQVITSILLAVTKRLKEKEDYENMEVVKETYIKLYTMMFKKKKQRTELLYVDEYYQQQIYNILSN